jgi:hypothetical protein
MRNLTELTASWEVVSGWKVAPEGCDFMVVGHYAKIGHGAKIGHYANNLQELGTADGFAIVIANVSGVAYISGGCRWMTLAAALKHVAGKDGYEQRRDAMEYAKIIAKREGWLFKNFARDDERLTK